MLVGDAVYRDQTDSISRTMAADGVSIERIKLRGRKAGRGRARVAVYARYVVAAGLRTLFGRPADLNLFLTQPPLFFLWGLALRLVRRQKYAIVLMDLYPDLLVKSGIASRRAPFVHLAAWLVRLAHRKADGVIVIGRCMRERMIRDGVRPGRIHVAPNWPPAEVRVSPRTPNALRDELGIGNRFVVMYSGNMGVAHRFDDILDVARRLREHDDICFVFAGDGPRRQEVERATARNELRNVKLLPFQPAERLVQSLSLGDVHFVSLREGFDALVVPSKTYGVLGVGRPVVYQGSRSGEIARMIEEESIGVVVEIGDVDGLQRAFNLYRKGPSRAEAEGRRAAELALGRYSRTAALDRYVAAIGSLS